MAIFVKDQIFQGVTPCSLAEVYRHSSKTSVNFNRKNAASFPERQYSSYWNKLNKLRARKSSEQIQFAKRALPFSLDAEQITETIIVAQEYYLLGYDGVSPLKVNQRFGGTYRLHLQGRRVRRKEKPSVKAVRKQSHLYLSLFTT
jgi:hypothetical protein